MIQSAPAPRRPVAIDLFSGAGGMSLGFESAGFDVVSAVEYDPVHAGVHLYNFPLTDVICRDIGDVTADDIIASARRGFSAHHPGVEWDGIIDAVVGGPSCQGFSAMGKQDADDERNQLILQFVRVVEELRPRSFCMENVPGLLDVKFRAVRDEASSRLRDAGYAISGESEILDATDFGVPQRRKRVVILGVLGSDVPPVRPRALANEMRFNVQDAFAGLPSVLDFPELTESDVLRLSPDASIGRASSNPYLSLIHSEEDGPGARGHTRMTSTTTMSGCRVTKHTAESINRFRATPAGKKEPISRLYKLSMDAPALTLRAGTGRERGSFSAARPLHPTEARVITVREAARLHSFPDWFRFHTTNWHGHRQIGNAVPPLLARAAASALLETMGVAPLRSDLKPMALGDDDLLSLNPSQAAVRFNAASDQVPKRRRLSTSSPALRRPERRALPV